MTSIEMASEECTRSVYLLSPYQSLHPSLALPPSLVIPEHITPSYIQVSISIALNL